MSLLAAFVHAQATWTIRIPPGSPAGRFGHAMAFDEARGVVLLFGGATATNGTLNDTWTWDGQTWSGVSPNVFPRARMGHTMVYDSVRQAVVLFGGASHPYVGPGFGDTWEWDGSRWIQRFPASAPPARVGHAMAFDRSRGVAVLYGGNDVLNGVSMHYSDTWEWDGQTWTHRYTGAPWRVGSNGELLFPGPMAYDEKRQRTVLFGGGALAGSIGLPPIGDTWEWDGTRWTQSAPSAGREGHAIAYDPLRERIVVFGGGGAGPAPLLTTLERDDTTWIVRSPPSPPARGWTAMAYDRMLLFGGNSLSDTWEYHTTPIPTYTPFGSGCTGSAGVPTLAAVSGARPWTGSTFTVELRALPLGVSAFMFTGFSITTWGPFALPLPLAAYGMPGCSLWVAPDVVYPVAVSGTAGQWDLPIPSVTSLVGVTFFNQGIVLDRPANQAGAVLSNAAGGVVSAK
jgi:hypothetical protein